MEICENNSIIVVLQGPKYTSAKDSIFFGQCCQYVRQSPPECPE